MKVSICGCGWLGFPLAVSLVDKGIDVWGSKQEPIAAQALEKNGISGVAITLPDDLDNHQRRDEIIDFLNADILIINIAPGRHEGADQDFIASVSLLSQKAKLAGCKHVLFISTTGVYGAACGQITESTPAQPETKSSKAHAQLEQYLLSEWGENAVVLRLAGLIGPNRHPVKFLSGRTVDHGKDRVNLIHQIDCIEAIGCIIDQWPKRQVFHLAAPSHPTRERYYSFMAQKAGLVEPEFSMSFDRDSKVVDATKTCEELSFSFVYPDLIKLKPEI
ncbi:NAD-dependent epimerase/dehydratase family protein [Photobacterium minamisatsumaniensis]|uniref:NAD-dependent epimerase/dehydratase family protein n=1 Tax=Photobacterium minamisatsumaniensis TaxID=2910233 RepID=UPI003D144F20